MDYDSRIGFNVKRFGLGSQFDKRSAGPPSSIEDDFLVVICRRCWWCSAHVELESDNFDSRVRIRGRQTRDFVCFNKRGRLAVKVCTRGLAVASIARDDPSPLPGMHRDQNAPACTATRNAHRTRFVSYRTDSNMGASVRNKPTSAEARYAQLRMRNQLIRPLKIKTHYSEKPQQSYRHAYTDAGSV